MSPPRSAISEPLRSISACVILLNFRRKVSSSSASSEEDVGDDDDGEGVWVEKTIKHDRQDAFVGPVPEIKVQASVTKKELVIFVYLFVLNVN